jgi:4-amino-4-deoxy-L-arabinose transferase-like glycosyltransferase
MAAFHLVAGPTAVLYVVPILGGLTVWATWLIGKGLGDQSAGAIAAVLMLMSPIFVLMLLTPMSDVPAAAFWSLSLAASLRRRTLWAGLAASVAILIRPNTVLLAAVPLLVVLTQERRGRVLRTAIFAGAIAPAASVIGLLLWHYYGSPLHSGYGSLGELFGFDRVAVNAEQYADWFFDSQTALPLIGLVAPAVHWNRTSRIRAFLVLTVFPCAVLALYLLYQFVIPADAWAYLRFLIPALPLLMVGFAIVVLELSRRAKKWSIVRATCAVLIWWAAVHGLQYAREHEVLGFKALDQRYARAVTYAQALPQTSILVSLGHSGPLRFYTGRDVLRFDSLNGKDIDIAIAYFESRGEKLFFIGDLFEVDFFREWFAGTEALDRLQSVPPVDLGGAVAYPLSREP